MEQIVLVDENDNQIGLMEKMEAHQKGVLHRAFSVFVFNNKNQLLLQRRAINKYHSGGLWTNTCCSHPRNNEDILTAGKRRLNEEMGFECSVKSIFTFIYHAKLNNELTEHELDHVLIGRYNLTPLVNKQEVEEWKYVDLSELEQDIKTNPQNYTVWFCKVFNRVKEYVLNNEY